MTRSLSASGLALDRDMPEAQDSRSRTLVVGVCSA